MSAATREPFDAFQVHACLPLSVLDPSYDNDGEVEQVDDADLLAEHADHVIWSVYGHRSWDELGLSASERQASRELGLTCLGDFDSYEFALDIAHALAATAAGVPVHDESPDFETKEHDYADTSPA
jgi:hypothetical protein